MKELRFIVGSLVNLKDELMKPIESIMLKKLPHGENVSVVLRHSDGSGLLIQSEMYDVGERCEIGVLDFSLIDEVDGEFLRVKAKNLSNVKLNASKLVIHDFGVKAESGVCLSDENDNRIIIVAGAFPNTISIMASFISDKFEPEYPISAYISESL
ncbi:MAG: hypothetical protein OEV64_14480 [Desulfobulbaceae bacterium]|nr:hypothetical protein [Desulfobulbaceae bacterium]